MKKLLRLGAGLLTALGMTACLTTGNMQDQKKEAAPAIRKTPAKKTSKVKTGKKNGGKSAKRTAGGTAQGLQLPRELLKNVPSAKGYTLVYKLNPVKYKSLQIDNACALSGKIVRLGYYLRLTDKTGKDRWVFVTMDPFTQDLNVAGLPHDNSGVFAKIVTNMEIFSNVPGLKTGTFAKGSVEFWNGNYNQDNAAKIPGASDKAYDFGDNPDSGTGYGSMQVHNYLNGQTVFALNNWRGGVNADVGIGNNPKGSPDWTFARNAGSCKSGVLLVVAKIDNMKYREVKKLDHSKIKISGKTEKGFYAVNEEAAIVLSTDFNGQVPDKPYFVKWTRIGDDGKTISGRADVVPGKQVVVKTAMAKPGFIRFTAYLYDSTGRAVMVSRGRKTVKAGYDAGIGFGAEKLREAVEEPKDFDAFWARQKARLDKVPLKHTMKELSKPGDKVKLYAVTVDCAGPRPVTGYLTIPAGAKPKSMGANLVFYGYGSGAQKPPAVRNPSAIVFYVNAHGFELGKDAKYYKDFAAKIQTGGRLYAFFKKENENPETAYFNGMALRIMRALQFVKTLPQWNGKRLAVSGSSQGGLQTIWAASLDKDVSFANASIPWCADLGGITKGRLRGWRPDYTPALRYYDIVYHAKRVKCPIMISAGLVDYICPPSGVCAVYNNIPGKKTIVWVQSMGHGGATKDAVRYKMEKK